MSTQDPVLRKLTSDAVRARRVSEGATCSVCGTDQQLCMVGEEVRCYEHCTSERSGVELHHLAGQANVPRLVVPLTGNAHREFHDDERALGLDGLPPANDEPLLRLAHILEGIGLLLVAFARWLAEYVTRRAKGLAPAPFPVVA